MKIERITVKNARAVSGIEKVAEVEGCIGCRGCKGVCAALVEVLTVPSIVASRSAA